MIKSFLAAKIEAKLRTERLRMLEKLADQMFSGSNVVDLNLHRVLKQPTR